VADGGEGTVDAFLAAIGGSKVWVRVKGPYMEDHECFYGLSDDGMTAIIELAACAGLPLTKHKPHPGQTTTFGVGLLMADAVKRGCRKLILGLGGSATNDFGVGAAAAVGVRFLDENGNNFLPVGDTLSQIAAIDMSGMLPEFATTEILTMCDVNNPLLGKNGAAYIFGPQKGADPSMVARLDEQLRAVAELVRRELLVDVTNIQGAGAAGGMGGGMVAFFNSQLQMGIEILLDLVDFDNLLSECDMVFTGEGRIDAQSLKGKVVIGVARRAKKQNIPVVALVGGIGDGAEEAYAEGVSGIFSINRTAIPLDEAMKLAGSNLKMTMDNLMRFLQLFEKT
jgi:glycerate kinase